MNSFYQLFHNEILESLAKDLKNNKQVKKASLQNLRLKVANGYFSKLVFESLKTKWAQLLDKSRV